MVKVSVIIPAYNSQRYLSEAIESALAQTFQDFEIIVIDDGSIDGTRAIVEDYVQKFPDKIKLLHQENQGMCVARNNGIKDSSGEYIALLDSDDKWLPQHLKESIEAIESEEGIGLVHANIRRVDENGNKIDVPTRNVSCLSGYVFEDLFLRKGHVASPTVIFKRECVERLGSFDENLTRLGSEDRDLWLRFAKEYKFKYIDKVLAHYRICPTSLSRKVLNMFEGRLYVIHKFLPENDKNHFLRRKALAKVYRDLGDEYLLDGNFSEARKQYARSLSFWPFQLWTLINLIKSVLRFKKS